MTNQLKYDSLMPTGLLRKLKSAVLYGADVAYFGQENQATLPEWLGHVTNGFCSNSRSVRMQRVSEARKDF